MCGCATITGRVCGREKAVRLQTERIEGQRYNRSLDRNVSVTQAKFRVWQLTLSASLSSFSVVMIHADIVRAGPQIYTTSRSLAIATVVSQVAPGSSTSQMYLERHAFKRQVTAGHPKTGSQTRGEGMTPQFTRSFIRRLRGIKWVISLTA